MSHSPFLVYKASAGAGKTYTLVKEYLKMIFSKGEHDLETSLRSVLAITFTNQAAAEMKGRILGELQRMAINPIAPQGRGMGPDLLRELNELRAEHTAEPPLDGDTLSKMAGRLYRIALHAYSDLSVSTIDSFTYRVVRTFAHDFGQPMKFDVMVEQREMTDQAVAQLLSLAGTEGQEELTAVMANFAERQMEEGMNYKIETPIAKLAEQLFSENAVERLRQLSHLSPHDFQSIYGAYIEAMNADKAQLVKVAKDMLATLHGIGFDETICFYGNNGYYGYLGRLEQGEIVYPTPRAVGAFVDGKLLAKNAPIKQQEAAKSIFPQLQQLYQQIPPLVLNINTYKLLLHELYSVALLGVLNEQLHLYANNNEVVHLSDFNKLINQMVEDEDNPAPFIYERLGSRYRHFLIDEFQDTSIMQWHNMVPLLENGVSQGAMSMVVGDGKQSIYRFRQGDVRQFIKLPLVEGMRHHGQVLSRKGIGKVVNLDANFRSAEPIVEFNNTFFSILAREVYANNPVLQDIYIGRTPDGQLRPKGEEELRQRVINKGDGYVQVELVNKATAEAEEFPNVNIAIYDRVLRTIEHLVSERGYAYRDIAVLTRSNSELANVGAYLTLNGNIPQTSTESFLLRNSAAVMAIVAVLRMLVDEENREAEADLLNRMASLGLVSPEGVAKACEGWAEATMHKLEEADLRKQVLASVGINLDLNYLASLGLYDCCEEIVRSLRLDGIETPYVATLLENVASFVSVRRHSVADFLQWFDKKEKLSVSSAESIDAVKMLTIHKAKGLGKPVVICPIGKQTQHPINMWVDVSDNSNLDALETSLPAETPSLPTSFVRISAKDTSHFDPICNKEHLMEEVDELNVLYVAFTRPQERLYVFSPDYGDVKKQDPDKKNYITLLHWFAPQGYEAGNEEMRHKVETSSGAVKATVALHRIGFPNWAEHVLVASPAEKAVNRIADDSKRFGTYVHDLLSHVNTEADLEQAISDFALTTELDDADRATLEAIARRVISHPDTSPFFRAGQGVKTECNLVNQGRLLRPDRLVFLPDQTWVVDFKTGAPSSEHHQQVADYCSAVQAMGYPSVSGYLVYLQPDVRVVRC